MGAKEQSGRTWPSIFWARGTICDMSSENTTVSQNFSFHKSGYMRNIYVSALGAGGGGQILPCSAIAMAAVVGKMTTFDL